MPKELFKKLNSLYSNFKGTIYIKEKEEKIEPIFFNFDVEDEDFIYEKVFLGNNEFIEVLKELNLEYNPSLTIRENLQFLKERGKIVNYCIFPILENNEFIVTYKKLYGGDYIFYTNKKRGISITKKEELS